MSKFYKTLIQLPWTAEHSQELADLYDSCKPSPGVRVSPPKPTDDEKDKAAAGELVQCEHDDVDFVLNPVTKKWTRASSAVGKLLVFQHGA